MIQSELILPKNYKPDMRDKFPYGLGCLKYRNCFNCPFKDCTYDSSHPQGQKRLTQNSWHQLEFKSIFKQEESK